jgi:hypothetical protein
VTSTGGTGGSSCKSFKKGKNLSKFTQQKEGFHPSKSNAKNLEDST